MRAKTSAARRRRKSLDAFIAEEMRNPEFRIHFREARAKSDIAHALAQARKRAGLTQAEVARRAGTTYHQPCPSVAAAPCKTSGGVTLAEGAASMNASRAIQGLAIMAMVSQSPR